MKSTAMLGKYAAEPKLCIEGGVEAAATYLGTNLGNVSNSNKTQMKTK